jgi:hypothetical protein
VRANWRYLKGARRTVALAGALAAVGLAAGCSANDRNSAPARTETVIQTVTTVAPATPRPRPRPAPPITPTYTAYAGSYFSVDYPDTWNVEAAEAAKGSLYDTTIRSLADPDLMVRVDVTPSRGAAIDVSSAARGVEQTLTAQPGYRELAFTPSTFQGYDSIDWEFLVREGGALLHKEDTFFVDEDENGVAILTQAPASLFARWQSAFAHVRQSLLVTPPAIPPPSNSGSSAADFCAMHTCIDSFYDGAGYIVQCNDGMWSHSGGLSGACSYHGGESRNIYDGQDSGGYGGSSGSGSDLGPGNGYTVTCADGSISHSGGIQGACSYHGGVP